jgi:hypothetical protein
MKKRNTTLANILSSDDDVRKHSELGHVVSLFDTHD